MKNTKREKLIKRIAPKKGAILGAILGYLISNHTIGALFLIIIRIHNNGHIPGDNGFIPGGGIIVILLNIICAILCAIYFEKTNARKREYFAMINNHRILSIDKIALSMSVSYEKAKKEINKMIEKGFFGNAYIDNTTRSIVLPISGVDINTKVSTTNKVCPSCGATNKVSSIGENKCEYCSTPLD